MFPKFVRVFLLVWRSVHAILHTNKFWRSFFYSFLISSHNLASLYHYNEGSFMHLSFIWSQKKKHVWWISKLISTSLILRHHQCQVRFPPSWYLYSHVQRTNLISEVSLAGNKHGWSTWGKQYKKMRRRPTSIQETKSYHFVLTICFANFIIDISNNIKSNRFKHVPSWPMMTQASLWLTF